jgi:isopenicillin-N N-acyltransferase like protein
LSRLNPVIRFSKKLFLVIAGLLIVLVVYFLASIYISTPEIKDKSSLNLVRQKLDTNFYNIGHNWLKKSKSGLWEMYLEGDAFERGVINGKLTKELAEEQETAFIHQIKELIPSDSYLNFLKYFVAYFNRNLTKHITEEYRQEIYGVSLSASDKYDALAPKYYRILNYHAAHDIGHALQDKNIAVGCTSFGIWNGKAENGKMIVGRNFDFYSGDDFAKNKIVAFVKPTTGYKYMYITWASFTGVVSGMNDQGLTVTINAAKSDIPTGGATPISLLAKEILQYSKNIKDAYAIAEKRQIFVSESILIGSSLDNKCYIIEKTPTKTNLYQEDRNTLVCPNHYQSEAFANDINNNKNIVESSSIFRKYRMEQLLTKYKTINYKNSAIILRDQRGINNKDIGLGNEKAINQLIAHHAVIFSPQDRLVWVSTQPFQLGEFICYDLTKVFAEAPSLKTNKEINETQLDVLPDTFLQSKGYKNFCLFKKIKNYIRFCSKHNLNIDNDILKAFVESNPNSYYTYQIIGDYYKKMHETKTAVKYYTTALGKDVATNKEREEIQKQIKSSYH